MGQTTKFTTLIMQVEEPLRSQLLDAAIEMMTYNSTPNYETVNFVKPRTMPDDSVLKESLNKVQNGDFSGDNLFNAITSICKPNI